MRKKTRRKAEPAGRNMSFGTVKQARPNDMNLPESADPQPRAKKGGTKKAEKERTCLVTGKAYPAHRLIRFVVSPEGVVIPDVAGKLPGRGGWLLAEGAVLERAMKKKIFIRFGHKALAEPATDKGRGPGAGRPQITVDDHLPQLVEDLLRQRCLDHLGLVNRAGLLVAGFEKVRALLKAGKCRALVTAEDAAEDGRRKLCAGLGNVLDKLRLIGMFNRAQLGQALGLSNPVHVALRPGGMTESFLKEFSRYEGVADRGRSGG